MATALRASFQDLAFPGAVLPAGFAANGASDAELGRSLDAHRREVEAAFAAWRRSVADAYEGIGALTERHRPARDDLPAAATLLAEIKLRVNAADVVIRRFDRDLARVLAHDEAELRSVRMLRPSIYDAGRRELAHYKSLADSMRNDLVDLYYRMLELEAENDPDSRERTSFGSTENLLAHLKAIG